MNPIKRIYTPVKTQSVVSGDDAPSTIVSDASPTIAAPAPPEASKNPAVTIPISAPEMLAKLRSAYLLFARTEQAEFRGAELCAMLEHIRSLTGSAELPGSGKAAQMANAFEALLIELHAQPKKITPSVIRTVAHAIDTLAVLFHQVPNLQDEVFVVPRILVLDDEIISREMICSALGKINATVVSSDDSIAARHLLEQEHFDLIFLGVEMPEQSGLELCVHIRQMATNRATPVVFVTSHSDFGSRAQSTSSGGNDFIAKPFLSLELAVKALTWLFKGKERQLSTPDVENTLNKNIEQRRELEVGPYAQRAGPIVGQDLILAVPIGKS